MVIGSLLATRLGASGRFSIRLDRPVLAANLSLSLFALPLAMLALAATAALVVGAYGLAMAGIGFLVARETGRRPRPALRGGRRRARPPRAAPRRSYDPAEILHLGWGATAFHIGG